MFAWLCTVCVLSVFSESCEDVIGNSDSVIGGLQLLYCSSVRFPLRKDYQHKRSTGENQKKTGDGKETERETESERDLRRETGEDKQQEGACQVDCKGEKGVRKVK